MFENSIVQISTGKLLGASLLPSSVLLVSGIIIWRFWRDKQSRLQTETDVLNDELRQIKEQLADLQRNNQAEPDESTQTANASSAASQQAGQKRAKSPGDMGLFEYLIEDNIQLRKSAS